MLPEMFLSSSLELLFLGQTFISWAEAAFFTDLFDLRSIDLELLSLFRGVPFCGHLDLISPGDFSPNCQNRPKLDAWKEKSDYNRLKQIKSILLPLYFVKSLLFRGITFYVQSSSGRPPALPMSNIVAVLIQQSLQTMKMWGGADTLWLWRKNFFESPTLKRCSSLKVDRFDN